MGIKEITMLSKVTRRFYMSPNAKGNAAAATGNVIDLRSDTITRPSLKMRDAMANAVVGDDIYKDCPTTNRLEAEVAKLLGKEAALLTASGC